MTRLFEQQLGCECKAVEPQPSARLLWQSAPSTGTYMLLLTALNSQSYYAGLLQLLRMLLESSSCSL